MSLANATPGQRAVLFAYHNVGVRALKALLDAGVEIGLVVTHTDNPQETIWFGSVAHTAADSGLPCITPADANAPEVLAACQAVAPDFLFSCYYRQMLGAPLLALPRRGAFNLHGSLLPRYRGRAPVNWAILHGERETGATLHVMDIKPDFGAIVEQQAVPILQDDNARDVFDKVTLAAEMVMVQALPKLLAGTAQLTPQTHLPGHYFGGRKAEDGRLPRQATGWQIHNLVRAVAPPDYPGAFFDCQGQRIAIDKTRLAHQGAARPTGDSFTLSVAAGQLLLTGTDGAPVRVLAARMGGQALDAARFQTLFGHATVAPDT